MPLWLPHRGRDPFCAARRDTTQPDVLWDGNREEPTVTPSFSHVVAGEIHWSGILQRGEWIGVEFRDDDEPEREWEASHELCRELEAKAKPFVFYTAREQIEAASVIETAEVVARIEQLLT